MDELNYSPFRALLATPERLAALPSQVIQSNAIAASLEAAALARKSAKDVLFGREQDFYHPRVEYVSTNGRDAARDRELAEEHGLVAQFVGALDELEPRQVAAIWSAQGSLDFVPVDERDAFLENVAGTMGYATHPEGPDGWRREHYDDLAGRLEDAQWDVDNALGEVNSLSNDQILQIDAVKRDDPVIGQALEDFNRLREQAVVNDDPRAYAALSVAYGQLGMDEDRMRMMEAATAANLRDALANTTPEEPNEVSEGGVTQEGAAGVEDEQDSDDRLADLYERFEREYYGSEPTTEGKEKPAVDTAPKKRDPKAIPDYFEDRYVKMGSSYVDWENGRRTVLIDQGTKLRAPRNYDADSIKAIFDIAEARGWTTVKISGTEEFRRAAYFEGASRGIEGVGYKPTDAERIAARESAERNGKVNTVHREEASPIPAATSTKAGARPNASTAKDAPVNASATSAPKAAPAAATTPPQSKAKAAPVDATPKPKQGAQAPQEAGEAAAASGAGAKAKPVVGTLLEHGAAKYQFDDKKTPSYYLKVKAFNGEEKVLWGVDFPRALDESGVKPGEQVEVKSLGKKAVTVLEPVLNEAGEVIGEKPVETHRTEWRVTPHENELARAYRDARDIEAQREASKDHPTLANAFAVKAAAKKFFSEHADVADRPRLLAAIDRRILQDLRDGVAIKDVMIRGDKIHDKQQQHEEAHER